MLFLSSRQGALSAARAGFRGDVCAMAPATSSFCTQHGMRVVIEADGGAVALATTAAAWAIAQRRRPALTWPTSTLGTQTAEHAEARALLDAAFDVRVVVAYDLVPNVAFDVVGLHETVCICMSPSAVMRMIDVAHAHTARPHGVVCAGASTARAYDAHAPGHWPRAVRTTAHTPDVVDATALLLFTKDITA
jgi:hypothetical protein